ncbi:Imm7 family immunity protein [Nocardia salmonicida]|uniref:Imm7 family immunity protein n=1 Tax=Nocardia salmonicida TaxID=53431 RepID=UPI002E2BEA92|nr:Imm7 family immunity protein [Nocardia salmonicida]
MFEYHGWVSIQSSAGDETDSELEAAYRAAQDAVAELRRGAGLIDTRMVNGAAQLSLSGLLNHRGDEGQQVIDCFVRVGRVAAGSYGLLYIRDDEDSTGRDNEFQVMVMKRGKVTTTRDTNLSPCIPVIEDDI